MTTFWLGILREIWRKGVLVISNLLLEKAMATHSSTLAWRIPWTEEPGRLQPMGSRRVRHDWATSLALFTFHFHALEKEMATHSSVLAWRVPGTGEPGGLLSMGVTQSRTRLKRLSSSSSSSSSRDLFKNIRDTKGKFHAKMGSIKDRNV